MRKWGKQIRRRGVIERNHGEGGGGGGRRRGSGRGGTLFLNPV